MRFFQRFHDVSLANPGVVLYLVLHFHPSILVSDESSFVNGIELFVDGRAGTNLSHPGRGYLSEISAIMCCSFYNYMFYFAV